MRSLGALGSGAGCVDDFVVSVSVVSVPGDCFVRGLEIPKICFFVAYKRKIHFSVKFCLVY